MLEEAIHETLANLRAECEPVFRFLYETGCRKEEAFSLKHSQVFPAERLVVLPKTKAGRLRYIALTKAAVEAVTRMPKVSEYVFYNPDTLHRWYDCRKPWVAARTKAGYTWLKVKDLRTAFGIRLANTPGLEKHTIQTLLGHSSLSTTERFYAFHSHRLAVQRGLRLIEGANEGSAKEEKGAA
jgi:integrase